jgi:uncharacterized protein (DUF1800 family)
MPSLAPHTGVLGMRLAKHLLKRSTFRYKKSMLDAYAAKTVNQAVNDLFLPFNNFLAEPIDYHNAKPWINDTVNGAEPIATLFFQRYYITGWWLDEAIRCETIHAKMQWFLHSIFIVDNSAGQSREYFDYLGLLKHYAVGNIKEFAIKMSQNNTMLKYLDGNSNTKTAPNENYAREFLELFTITKGAQIEPGNYTNYTEADVQTAAKVLTGWRTSTRNLGVNPQYADPASGTQLGYADYGKHTTGSKTFSSAFGNTIIAGATDSASMTTELTAFVNMVFAQQQTAISYCKRLYRYFVSDKITAAVQTDIIVPLANELMANNYNLTPVLKTLLKSKHFYDQDDTSSTDNIIGSIIRSPFEQLAQAVSFFDLTIPHPVTNTENHYHNWYHRTLLTVLFPFGGLEPFKPENVAGYSAYYQEPGYSRNWFNASTLIARYKLYDLLITGNRVFATGSNGGIQLFAAPFVKNSGYFSNPGNATTLVTEFCNYLLPETPTPQRLQYYLDYFLDNLSTTNWMFEWQAYLTTNIDTSVKIPIQRLMKVLLSSQEYQVR